MKYISLFGTDLQLQTFTATYDIVLTCYQFTSEYDSASCDDEITFYSCSSEKEEKGKNVKEFKNGQVTIVSNKKSDFDHIPYIQFQIQNLITRIWKENTSKKDEEEYNKFSEGNNKKQVSQLSIIINGKIETHQKFSTLGKHVIQLN